MAESCYTTELSTKTFYSYLSFDSKYIKPVVLQGLQVSKTKGYFLPTFKSDKFSVELILRTVRSKT